MITNIIYVVVGCISYTTSFALLVHFLKLVPKRLDKVMEEAKKPFITEEDLMNKELNAYAFTLFTGCMLSFVSGFLNHLCCYFNQSNMFFNLKLLLAAIIVGSAFFIGAIIYMDFFYYTQIKKKYPLVTFAYTTKDYFAKKLARRNIISALSAYWLWNAIHLGYLFYGTVMLFL